MDRALKRKVLTGVFGFLSVFSIICAMAAATSLRYYNRVLPNTYLAGVEISNDRPETALAKLQQKAEELKNQSITLQLEDQTVQATLPELGIDLSPELSSALVTSSDDMFLWLKPRFWQSFFSKKTEALPHSIDEEKLRVALNEKFGVTNTAKDAAITVVDNALTVQPSTNGIWLDFSGIENQIASQITTGSLTLVSAQFTETQAAVSTEVAASIKSEIEATLKPINLVTENRKFLLSVTDQYSTIEYVPGANSLTWSISKDKLQSLINSKIAARINLKMVQKTILSDTGEVTNAGKEGREVELAKLTDQVYRIITERNFEEIVSIPVRSIAITDKIIYPDYVANLFPGLYVDISLKTQTLYIMNGATRVNQFLISSGRAGTPTPKGLFYIKNKIDIAQSRLYPGIWMRNWNALARNPDGSGYEGYGIHDLPAFNAEYTIIEGSSHLGRPVSHGCVRLGHDASVWFYQNIPVGTPVNIH